MILLLLRCCIPYFSQFIILIVILFESESFWIDCLSEYWGGPTFWMFGNISVQFFWGLSGKLEWFVGVGDACLIASTPGKQGLRTVHEPDPLGVGTNPSPLRNSDLWLNCPQRKPKKKRDGIDRPFDMVVEWKQSLKHLFIISGLNLSISLNISFDSICVPALKTWLYCIYVMNPCPLIITYLSIDFTD